MESTLPQECEVRVTVVNRLGLHARPATAFVQLAQQYDSDVRVRRDDQEVDGKSVMQMMLLAATQGVELSVKCVGVDCETACSAIADLVARGFDEE
ncbi:MAG: HPr family phosphocarrier protein [Planctomycetota bacterium]